MVHQYRAHGIGWQEVDKLLAEASESGHKLVSVLDWFEQSEGRIRIPDHHYELFFVKESNE